jgi:NAD+ synthase (glutamine-hydrolysing)
VPGHTTNPGAVHVAAASLNQTVGAWTENRERIQQAIAEARERGARLLLLPEMCISGYSLGDRLLRKGTLERSWDSLQDLLPHTHGMIVCLGLPLAHNGVLFNAMAVCADGKIGGLVAKENLATGDVEYESRWYSPWRHGVVEQFVAPDGSKHPLGSQVFEAPGIGRFGIEICEDGWKGIRPGSTFALSGCEILLNPSASWFHIGKHATRRRLVEQVSKEDHVAYLYTSLLGCDATRIVFDGSVLIASDGKMLQEGKRFVFEHSIEMVDQILDLQALRQARREEGSWREQAHRAASGEFGKSPAINTLTGNFGTGVPVPADPPYWEVSPEPPADASLEWLHLNGHCGPITHSDVPHLELELAIAIGLRDYTSKCGIKKIALALSGGRDSAMVAVLVQRMHHYANPKADPEAIKAIVNKGFLCAYMATENSGEKTALAAKELAGEIGARFEHFGIQEAVKTHVQLIENVVNRPLSWENPVDDLALQNVQARLRGSLIWMLANLDQALLLSTSNKSEAAVGYTTMDGDTSGGLSPIADIPKSLVSLWLEWARDFHGVQALHHVTKMEPTAELRPKENEQTDEGDLMPFFILDQLLYEFVQKAHDPLDIFKALWPTLNDHYKGDPKAFAKDIHRFVKLFCRAQWKRERLAISFRITAFDLDPKTGFRFPAVQSPFREELADLKAYVETLP